ncbi:MAG: pilus assembly protein TadG-related protein, partial [Dehalococcoidia bacterium]
MAALMMAVLVAAVGLAIDAGRLFIARAELVRAVDAAALAATLELPDLSNAQTKAITYMQQNEPTAVTQAVTSPTDRQIQVTGTKTVNVIFMKVFGISSVSISASATAGFGILAVDTVMAIDATGS